jgi:hypothetical protein
MKGRLHLLMRLCVYSNLMITKEGWESYTIILGTTTLRKTIMLHAEESYRKAIGLFEEMDEKYGSSASFGYLGNLYAKQNKNKQGT